MPKKDAKLITVLLKLAAERDQRGTDAHRRLAAWLRQAARELSR